MKYSLQLLTNIVTNIWKTFKAVFDQFDPFSATGSFVKEILLTSDAELLSR